MRLSIAPAVIAVLGVASGPALGGNGYVNMPERGCPPNFTERPTSDVPGFALSDINQDHEVCAMPSPGLPGVDVVVDNTSNAGGS